MKSTNEDTRRKEIEITKALLEKYKSKIDFYIETLRANKDQRRMVQNYE